MSLANGMPSIVVLWNKNKKKMNLEPDSESHGVKYLKSNSELDIHCPFFFFNVTVWGKSERDRSVNLSVSFALSSKSSQSPTDFS